jgi:hypothetical protein
VCTNHIFCLLAASFHLSTPPLTDPNTHAHTYTHTYKLHAHTGAKPGATAAFRRNALFVNPAPVLYNAHAMGHHSGLGSNSDSEALYYDDYQQGPR